MDRLVKDNRLFAPREVLDEINRFDEIKDWEVGTLRAVLKIVDGSNHTFNPMRWSNYETSNYKTVTGINQYIEGYKVGLKPSDYKKYYRVGLNMRRF